MCWRTKPANRALRSGNNIQTSLTLTEPRSADTQLNMGMLLLNVMYIDIHDYTMHVLVKIKGGAKTGTAHLQNQDSKLA